MKIVDENQIVGHGCGGNITVREMILALRGEPEKCDFCKSPKPVNQLHPEEGGDWICEDCLAKESL